MSKCDLCDHPMCSGAHTVPSIKEFCAAAKCLNEGWTQAYIAQELRLSKGYVAAIAKGWASASLCGHCGVAFFPKRTGTKKQRFDRRECADAYARGEEPGSPVL